MDKRPAQCVILPANDVSLFVPPKTASRSFGTFFSISQVDHVSFISTTNNFLIGDCVLGLKKYDYQSIYLFGPCGGLSGLRVGDKVAPYEVLNLESFSDFLTEGVQGETRLPNVDLHQQLIKAGQSLPLKPVRGATVNSLVLENQFAGELQAQKIQCLDMEASLVFSASAFIGRPCAALFYVTDIVNPSPMPTELSAGDKDRIKTSRKDLAEFLMDFIINEST